MSDFSAPRQSVLSGRRGNVFFALRKSDLLGRRGRAFPLPQNPLFQAGVEQRFFRSLKNRLLQAGAEEQLFRSPKNPSINPPRESDFSALRKIDLSGIRGRAAFPLTEKSWYRAQGKSDVSALRKVAI